MQIQPFTAPRYNDPAFHCPHCNAYANQLWGQARASFGGRSAQDVADINFARCSCCQKETVWVKETQVFPLTSAAPVLNPDISDGEIKKLYSEATAIIAQSPIAASALLRVALNRLCADLGDNNKDIAENIALLVEKGLDARICKSLELVRVIGSNAVAAGNLEMKDTEETATNLCHLLNLIAEMMITLPNAVTKLYMQQNPPTPTVSTGSETQKAQDKKKEPEKEKADSGADA